MQLCVALCGTVQCNLHYSSIMHSDLLYTITITYTYINIASVRAKCLVKCGIIILYFDLTGDGTYLLVILVTFDLH